MWEYNHTPDPSVLIHHGIKGMKWGVRRYQNKDGTLTKAGIKRYGSEEEKAISDKIDEVQRRSGQYMKQEREKELAKGRTSVDLDNDAKFQKKMHALYEKAFEEVHKEKWTREAEVRTSGDKELQKWYEEEKKQVGNIEANKILLPPRDTVYQKWSKKERDSYDARYENARAENLKQWRATKDPVRKKKLKEKIDSLDRVYKAYTEWD